MISSWKHWKTLLKHSCPGNENIPGLENFLKKLGNIGTFQEIKI